MFYAYILRSLKDGSYNYGSTSNVSDRVKRHNSGKVRYTKGHLPYKVHYSEGFATRHEAIMREKFFKSIAGYRRLKEEGIVK